MFTKYVYLSKSYAKFTKQVQTNTPIQIIVFLKFEKSCKSVLILIATCISLRRMRLAPGNHVPIHFAASCHTSSTAYCSYPGVC